MVGKAAKNCVHGVSFLGSRSNRRLKLHLATKSTTSSKSDIEISFEIIMRVLSQEFRDKTNLKLSLLVPSGQDFIQSDLETLDELGLSARLWDSIVVASRFEPVSRLQRGDKREKQVSFNLSKKHQVTSVRLLTFFSSCSIECNRSASSSS